MHQEALEKLKYPIGQFYCPDEITTVVINQWISALEELPEKLEKNVSYLSAAQLNTPYRPGGWTVRQLIHHIADSHHNSYIRFKWALTEDNPTIKAYDEKAWSTLFDATEAPIEMSLLHIKAVHQKLVYLLKGLSTAQLNRTFVHPEGNTVTSLKENIGRYAWHGNHHLAHLTSLIKRKGW